MTAAEAVMLTSRISWGSGAVVMALAGFSLAQTDFGPPGGFVTLLTLAVGFVLTSKPKADLNFVHGELLRENKRIR